MRRSAVVLLILFAMLWQSVAMARIGSTVNVLADLQHAALHLQEESHHHHDDGSYHLDESPDAAQHLLSDQLNATTALLSTAPHLLFMPTGSAATSSLHATRVPNPVLEGLFRPPRTGS